MTAVSDETGRDWLPLKYEDGPDFCTVTFATGAAFALTVHPERMKLMEAALSASPVGELTPEQISIQNDMFAAWVGDPKFREAFRNDCKRLLNAASASPVAQEPVAWADPDLGKRISKLAAKLVVSGYMASEHGVEPAAKRAERELLEFACDETQRYLEQRTPPATPAGVGADEIRSACIEHASLNMTVEAAHQQADRITAAILALLSRAGDQSQQRPHEEQSTQNI